MTKSKYDIGYIAAGAHELGHAQNTERSRYPKTRNTLTSLEPIGNVVAPIAGLTASSRFGPAGGAVVGGGLRFAASVPTLIEEYQATKNALSALKASGRYSAAEYKKAKNTLDSAYRTYITSALSSSAIAASIGSGRAEYALPVTGTALVADNLLRRRQLKPVLSSLRAGTPEGKTRISKLKKEMGVRAEILPTRLLKLDKKRAEGAFYAPPAHAVNPLVRKAYEKELRSRMRHKKTERVLRRGGAFIP